ncbi:acylneuraminate cytidylyltransferase family protein [Solitalea sp. MAHUQ-68]|uniref:Acylneuraminate cytidylyltransferase family protein n=1 Tax=Solitalea agri TaxID=2953739 RepID=A0A9X2F1Y1_9SPHI|nr:acylneuraminate cytidylyltransferase family protein [Solitalea agri]MCO4293112.1 acylneuraminate cytidylyltransferase family protein [Solitalea agri]
MSDTLFVLPARGGSKGIPLKNIKLLGDKPLIQWSIEVAKKLTIDEHICMTTDSPHIKEVVEQFGLRVPFLRPDALATDSSGTYEVLLHALSYYEGLGRHYKKIVLLQPTSPFRTKEQVEAAIELYADNLDMVVSVKESRDNPYYNLFEENLSGFLSKSKESQYVRRQDCPSVYAYNGAIYVINVDSLKAKPIHQFVKIKKYLMDDITSVDIDIPLDWEWAEFLIKRNLLD